jgi:hypothetical protein
MPRHFISEMSTLRGGGWASTHILTLISAGKSGNRVKASRQGSGPSPESSALSFCGSAIMVRRSLKRGCSAGCLSQRTAIASKP